MYHYIYMKYEHHIGIDGGFLGLSDPDLVVFLEMFLHRIIS
jgi:hypothetical protein